MNQILKIIFILLNAIAIIHMVNANAIFDDSYGVESSDDLNGKFLLIISSIYD